MPHLKAHRREFHCQRTGDSLCAPNTVPPFRSAFASRDMTCDFDPIPPRPLGTLSSSLTCPEVTCFGDHWSLGALWVLLNKVGAEVPSPSSHWAFVFALSRTRAILSALSKGNHPFRLTRRLGVPMLHHNVQRPFCPSSCFTSLSSSFQKHTAATSKIHSLSHQME